MNKYNSPYKFFYYICEGEQLSSTNIEGTTFLGMLPLSIYSQFKINNGVSSLNTFEYPKYCLGPYMPAVATDSEYQTTRVPAINRLGVQALFNDQSLYWSLKDLEMSLDLKASVKARSGTGKGLVFKSGIRPGQIDSEDTSNLNSNIKPGEVVNYLSENYFTTTTESDFSQLVYFTNSGLSACAGIEESDNYVISGRLTNPNGFVKGGKYLISLQADWVFKSIFYQRYEERKGESDVCIGVLASAKIELFMLFPNEIKLFTVFGQSYPATRRHITHDYEGGHGGHEHYAEACSGLTGTPSAELFGRCIYEHTDIIPTTQVSFKVVLSYTRGIGVLIRQRSLNTDVQSESLRPALGEINIAVEKL